MTTDRRGAGRGGRVRRATGFRAAWRLLAAGSLASSLATARADPALPLVVGVRSAVLDPPVKSSGAAAHPGGPGHGQVYAILSVQLVPAEQRLVKPVDANALVQQLIRVLDALGYREMVKGQNPGILLTMQYGRGYVSNPYAGDAHGLAPVTDISVVYESENRLDQMANQDIIGTPHQLMNERSLGYEARLQKAGYEKLFIRITAWQYPTDPKAKARQLWHTTMVADDPDHQDLNVVAPEMLVAGGRYFDRDVPDREIEVSKPLVEGHVKVGTPEPVDPAPPATGPRSPPPPVAVPAAPERTMSFDLPAGDATATLQMFSRQSGEQIIYPAEQLVAVRTRGISGEFAAHEALDRMLAGTGLVAVLDEKTGVFVIHLAK